MIKNTPKIFRRLFLKVRQGFASDKFPYIFFLLLVYLFVFYSNFPWGKWLLGWDNLLPELNFKANFARTVFSLWQENQGLGTTGGHGYASNLPHIIFTYLLSFILPVNYLRPTFLLLLLLIGSLGSFFLIDKLLFLSASQKTLQKTRVRHFSSLIAGLFYMLNFGTVQMFYIPLEAFAYHFAFLPWLFLSAILIFEDKTKRNIAIFSLLSFISSAQGFIPPMFLVYFLLLLVFCVLITCIRRSLDSLKALFVILAVTLVTNFYWLLPFVFYSTSRASIYLNSYNNLMTTDDFVLKTQKYGSFENLVLLRGFIYDSTDALRGGENFFIFTPWKVHLENFGAVYIYYLLFGLISAGIYFALRKSHSIVKAFVALFLISFVFLSADFYPLSLISGFLRNNVLLLRQAFRISFTKFSLSMAFLYSMFLANGVYFLLNKVSDIKLYNLKKFTLAIPFLTIFLILYSALPVFSGNFFYNRIRIDLPQEYQLLFDFFKDKKSSSRIANFPQYTPTGWSLYKWGYSGSGFLWYGLTQPILDRNFDVWSNFNENYYWQISQAVYSRDIGLLEDILSKYQIEYLILDGNVVSFTPPKSLFLPELKSMLAALDSVSLASRFGNVEVYEVDLGYQTKNSVFLAQNLPSAYPRYSFNDFDRAFSEYGHYLSFKKGESQFNPVDVYYPFRSLFTGRRQSQLEFLLHEKDNQYIFKTNIPQEYDGSFLVVPPLSQEEFVSIDEETLTRIMLNFPRIFLDGEEIVYTDYFSQGVFQDEDAPGVEFDEEDIEVEQIIPLGQIRRGVFEVRVPKISGVYSFESQDSKQFVQNVPFLCDYPGEGKVKYNRIDKDGDSAISFEAVDSSICFDLYLPQLSNRLGYLIKTESRNISGKPLLVWMENLNSKRANFETYLEKNKNWQNDYFIQPPMEKFGLGYTLHFKNKSIGRVETENELSQVSINPIPYKFLTSFKIVPQDTFTKQNRQPIINTKDIVVDKNTPTSYQVSINYDTFENEGGNRLVLSQSYDKGWRAYQISCQLPAISCQIKNLFPFVFFEEIKDHVMVNNWQNGWIIKPTTHNLQHITIIYWPQYLQYLGFLILGVVPVIFVLAGRKRNLKKI